MPVFVLVSAAPLGLATVRLPASWLATAVLRRRCLVHLGLGVELRRVMFDRSNIVVRLGVAAGV